MHPIVVSDVPVLDNSATSTEAMAIVAPLELGEGESTIPAQRDDLEDTPP
jgi:hypothetical protein